MSYTCRDFGPGQICDGCPHNPLGMTYTATTAAKVHPDGMNRAERRAAAKRLIGYAKHPCQLCGGLHSTVDCMTKGAR